MKPFLRAAVFLPIFLSLFTVSAPAADFDALYKKAEAAFAARDSQHADFYVARYLGLAAADSASGKGVADIDRLYVTHPPTPVAFLSSVYDPGFMDWFEKAMLPLWGVSEDRVREKYGSVEVRSVREGKRFAVVTAYPKIEAWFRADDTQAGSKRLLLAVGSSAKGRRATLIAGVYADGRRPVSFKPMELNSQSHALQYVWEPFFSDVDGDGTPELWIRYNLTWGNGFTQFLDIYRMDEKELTLLKRFTGANEGLARRTAAGKVETATGRGSMGGLSHFEYDTHRLQTWEWRNGAFEKTEERDIPHLLRSGAWRETVGLLASVDTP
jgi:hypothetical protein